MKVNIYDFFILMEFFLVFNFLILFALRFLVPFFMYFLSLLVSYKDYYFFKLRSYECGFDVSGSGGFSVNVVFFSIVLMFVIFELEVVIFFVLVQGDFYSVFSFFVFFSYVVLSYYMELYFGKLVWFF